MTSSRRRTEAVRDARRLLSAVSMEHGTPPAGIELARYTFGGRIGFDPATSAYWNHYSVKADRFCDLAANGLVQPWGDRTLVNAPGADEEQGTETLVRPFWERSIEMWRSGAVDGLVWIGYSVQQLGMLQGSPAHPLLFPTVFPCERFKFLRRPPTGGPPVPGEQPMHFNYVTLLPTVRGGTSGPEARAQVARFRERAAQLGALVRSFNP